MSARYLIDGDKITHIDFQAVSGRPPITTGIRIHFSSGTALFLEEGTKYGYVEFTNSIYMELPVNDKLQD